MCINCTQYGQALFVMLDLRCNFLKHPFNLGARCSSVVTAFAHGAMDPLTYFSFQPCFTTGVTKAVVCVILYVG